MWKFSFKSISQWLLALAIILVPFSDLQYLENIVGEMAREGAFYPLLVAMILWGSMLAKGMRLKIPKHASAKILVLFWLWICISSTTNMIWIIPLQTKGRTGVEKLVFQLVLMLFVMLSALLVFNIVSYIRQPLSKFRHYVLISFLIAGLYSLIEITFLSGSSWAEVVLQAIDVFVRSNTFESSKLYSGRLRSVSNEPSWFAMYCSFILPWIFSYVFTVRKNLWVYLILSMYFILLIVLTQSRTAYFITTLQLSLFLLGLLFSRQDFTRKTRLFLFKKNRFFALVIVIAIAIVFAGISFSKTIFADISVLGIFSSLVSAEGNYNVSNLTRFGSQAAAFKIAIDHPFFGVGLGQYGFYMPAYLPLWATLSPEIHAIVSPLEGTPWPSVYSIYARIAAELGWIGLGIWLSLWTTILAACYKRYQLNNHINNQRDILGLALMVSIIGVILSGLTTDSLRFFGFWIDMGLAWSYLRKPKTTPLNGSLLSQFGSVSNQNAEQ